MRTVSAVQPQAPASPRTPEKSPERRVHKRDSSAVEDKASIVAAKRLKFEERKPESPILNPLLPDPSGLTSFGGYSTPTPETPARQVSMDPFRQNLQQIVQVKQIVMGQQTYAIGDWIGSGRFSDVYALAKGHVIKIPNRLATQTTKTIQRHQESAKKQYEILWAMREELTEIGLDVAQTSFQNGVIVQPYSASWEPKWNKGTKWEDLTVEQLAILKIAKAGFAFFMKKGVPIDFRPQNLGKDSKKFIIRDFYEAHDEDQFSDLARDLLEQWANGNEAIFRYLDPRETSSSSQQS